MQAPNNIVTYSLGGVGDAANYFYIDPSTGALELIKSVAANNKAIYEVVSCIITLFIFNFWCVLEMSMVLFHQQQCDAE